MSGRGGVTYFMANKNNKVLYVGVSSELFSRVYKHKTKEIKGFTSRYNVNKLVYYEVYSRIEEAIAREKQIKKWPRKKKDELVNKYNPEWKDLFEEIKDF